MKVPCPERPRRNRAPNAPARTATGIVMTSDRRTPATRYTSIVTRVTDGWIVPRTRNGEPGARVIVITGTRLITTTYEVDAGAPGWSTRTTSDRLGVSDVENRPLASVVSDASARAAGSDCSVSAAPAMA
jgi:hypothetical protein